MANVMARSGAAGPSGKNPPCDSVLRNSAPRYEQGRSESDEDGDDSNLDHGEPEFKAAVRMHRQKINGKKENRKDQYPDYGWYTGKP